MEKLQPLTYSMMNTLAAFRPDTLLRDWGGGEGFRITDALTGIAVFGATGSGKTSGVAKHIAYGYLAAGFGGLVLCAKKEERKQWETWCEETGRTQDLIIVDAAGTWRFNFMEWEASRPEEGGGLAINIVAILDEIASAVARSSGKADSGGGDNKFWEDALHHLNVHLVSLPILAGLRVSFPLLRSLLDSAPISPEQANDPEWQNKSVCAVTLREAAELIPDADPEWVADFEACRNYFLREFPALSEKTRSIITLTFSMLTHPFLTRPLRKIFCSDTNLTPEAAFTGKIILVDLPVQEFRLVGKVASLAFKFCYQVAVLRRSPPSEGYLRPCFLWCDEAQNFLTHFDAEYQAVARSAGGCTVYLTQNRESYRRVLGNSDAVDSLLGNLQAKFFCLNSGETNEWASRLFGERWRPILSTNLGRSRNERLLANDGSHSSGVNRSEQSRRYVEPSRFITLKRGGPAHGFQVQAIVYNGGQLFEGPDGELLPYRLLTFNQR